MSKGTSINDSIHGLIRMTAYEKGIISTAAFNRLHDVYQNSTSYLTFPSNRTKRYEHSIGTMKISSDIFYYSVLNSRKKDLEELLKFRPQKIILGCTHYPFLLDNLSKYVQRDMFIDPARCFAKEIINDLAKHDLINEQEKGKITCYVSSNPKSFSKNSKIFFDFDLNPMLLNEKEYFVNI